MAGREYWKKRKLEETAKAIDSSNIAAKELAQIYIQALDYLTGRIKGITARMTDSNDINLREAREIVKAMGDCDITKLQKYVKKAKIPPEKKKKMLDLLNTPAYMARIRRLIALQQDVLKLAKTISSKEYEVIEKHLKNICENSYYKGIFEIQQQAGYAIRFSGVNKDLLDYILNYNWSGKHYSQRIWQNADNLAYEVRKELAINVLTGRSSIKAARALAERFSVGIHKAQRLIRTESSYVHNMAEMESYKALDITQYEYVATLDTRTCREECGRLDGKIFDVDKAETGVNLPPMHPYCRCTTVAYVSNEIKQNWERTSINPKTGQTEHVPASMTYEEWRKKFVDGDNNAAGKTDREVKKEVDKKEDEIKIVPPTVDMQNYKPVISDLENQHIIRKNGKELTVSRLVNTKNNIYISSKARIKPKQQQELDRNITEVLNMLNVKDKSIQPMVAILSDYEMAKNAVASYNSIQNIVYVRQALLDYNKLPILQEQLACPDNKYSTILHEYIHWLDAEKYRTKNGGYNSPEDYDKYINDLRAKCKVKLDIAGINDYNVSGISDYASKEYTKSNYDEVYTEYRVKLILEGERNDNI